MIPDLEITPIVVNKENQLDLYFTHKYISCSPVRELGTGAIGEANARVLLDKAGIDWRNIESLKYFTIYPINVEPKSDISKLLAKNFIQPPKTCYFFETNNSSLEKIILIETNPYIGFTGVAIHCDMLEDLYYIMEYVVLDELVKSRVEFDWFLRYIYGTDKYMKHENVLSIDSDFPTLFKDIEMNIWQDIPYIPKPAIRYILEYKLLTPMYFEFECSDHAEYVGDLELLEKISRIIKTSIQIEFWKRVPLHVIQNWMEKRIQIGKQLEFDF